MNPWEILGIENAADKRTIKKAYTRLLKQIDVDANPAAFQELREAYELALALCEGNFIFDERFFSDEPTQVEIEPGERDFSPPEPRATDRSEFGESDIEIEPENRDSRPFPNEPEITPGPAYQAHLRVENLMQTLRVSGDMDAIRELKQITKEEIYESLDFKQHLEEELLEALCDMEYPRLILSVRPPECLTGAKASAVIVVIRSIISWTFCGRADASPMAKQENDRRQGNSNAPRNRSGPKIRETLPADPRKSRPFHTGGSR